MTRVQKQKMTDLKGMVMKKKPAKSKMGEMTLNEFYQDKREH